MDRERYLGRLGVDPDRVRRPDYDALAHLQRTHVTAVPFENLAIVGDPVGPRDGDGVSLAVPALYDKLVARRRGGFCFELNGLFAWLLTQLGFEPDRLAARIVSDGEPGPPACHHTIGVTLPGRGQGARRAQRYIVDVGLGTPAMRRPLPLDGDAHEDEIGVAWRAIESDRPDADYLVQYRSPGDDSWTDRYLVRDKPRDLDYFEATCDHLATAPESPFTGDPIVSIATERGHVKLSGDTLTRTSGGETHEEHVTAEEWHDVLEREFGVRYEKSVS